MFCYRSRKSWLWHALEQFCSCLWSVCDFIFCKTKGEYIHVWTYKPHTEINICWQSAKTGGYTIPLIQHSTGIYDCPCLRWVAKSESHIPGKEPTRTLVLTGILSLPYTFLSQWKKICSVQGSVKNTKRWQGMKERAVWYVPHREGERERETENVQLYIPGTNYKCLRKLQRNHQYIRGESSLKCSAHWRNH